MPEALPYMRLWVDDLLSDPDAQAMTDEEFGIYMRLLTVAWKKGGIPVGAEQQARSVKASPRKLARLWPALADKWVSDGNGRLVNPRMERERKEAIRLHRKRVAAGKAGAEARWADG